MKYWIAPLIALLAACERSDLAPTIEGIHFVEEVTAQAGQTSIPYKKYTLDNGLTLILHEDHSDPLVHVDVTYHVGSAREEPGKSGFAHFFEHMMYQGSKHVADEQHFKIVTEAGSNNLNGSTSNDRTNYYQTVPANQLEKMLWLESDRMGFLLEAVTQEKFEVQRDTVKNERGQRVDNQPYGRLYERVDEALYPYGHPYSWPTIGYIEDLNRANVNDLKAFFLRWYGPNNATLTIGGNIDNQQTLALVKKYFGPIPKGPEITAPKKELISLEQDRYISMEDNVHLPLIYMSYPTVHVRHADEAPLDLLAEIIGHGKTSLLYKNLVKTQIAVNAGVNHPCEELACTFNFIALPHPASGKSLADIEKIMRASLDEFEQRGVQQDDLIKAKAKMEASFVFGLQSVAGKVSQLAINQTFNGNPNYIEQDIERYNNVTKEDVQRVFETYIKGKHAVIMSVVPKGQLAAVAAPDNFTPQPRAVAEISQTTEQQLALRPTPETFDRNIMPGVEANKAVDVPAFWQSKLGNGIDILGTQSLETPTTTLLIKIPAGHLFETPAKAGSAALLADMLNESTKTRSGEAMALAMEKLGSRVSVTANGYNLAISVNTLTKNLGATLALVNEKITQPAFKPGEFERIQNNAIEQLRNARKDTNYLAQTAYRKLMYKDGIAAIPESGSEESLKNITLADIVAFYESHVKPAGSTLIAVSDLSQPEILKHLEAITQWQGTAPELSIPFPMPETKTGVVYLVNKDDAAQSSIRIGKRTMARDFTGEFYQASLMNFTLGDAFNSRINLNLREDKGYTYGARSYFSGNKDIGVFTAAAEVRADVTDKAIVEIVKEIKHYAEEGISAEELEFMRKAINQKDALEYETPSAKLGFLAQILEYKLTPDFVKQQEKIVATISAEEINALAKKHLNLDEMVIVVVGNATILQPELQALGYQVVNYEI